MTTELTNTMIFLIANYHQEQMEELSYARLTKLVYLSDWHFAINHKKQITGIEWYYDIYGPITKEVEKTALNYSNLFITDFGNNEFGQPKKTLRLREPNQKLEIGKNEEITFNHIIEVTSDLLMGGLINLFYSTYPVRAAEQFTFLNLPMLAAEYQK